jgi:hypothetical protein
VVLVSAYQIGSSTAGKERRGTSGTMEDQRDTTDVEESLREVSIKTGEQGTLIKERGKTRMTGGFLVFSKMLARL